MLKDVEVEKLEFKHNDGKNSGISPEPYQIWTSRLESRDGLVWLYKFALRIVFPTIVSFMSCECFQPELVGAGPSSRLQPDLFEAVHFGTTAQECISAAVIHSFIDTFASEETDCGEHW